MENSERSIGVECTIQGRTFRHETPRGIVADWMDECGRHEDAGLLRTDKVLDVTDYGRVSEPDMSVADVLEVNGQNDDSEPWCVMDGSIIIEPNGEGIIGLCTDGLVEWDNGARRWSQVTHWEIARVIGMGRYVDEQRRIAYWWNQIHDDHQTTGADDDAALGAAEMGEEEAE
jgi:hypothetical protein